MDLNVGTIVIKHITVSRLINSVFKHRDEMYSNGVNLFKSICY